MNPAPDGDPVLGIDAGTVRVGVAASDPSLPVATPVAVLRRDAPRFWDSLLQLVRERGASHAVVGLPLRADGGEGDAAQMARTFAAELQRRSGCEVTLWDERFTSQQAERSLLQGGMRRRQRREHIDAVAATLLLQSWLDHRYRAASP